MSRFAKLDNVAPLSGLLSGPRPARRASFYYVTALVLLLRSVTPLAWATALWWLMKRRRGRRDSRRRSLLARCCFIVSLLEVPFSVYLAWLEHGLRQPRPPPTIDVEQLRTLLMRSLAVGLAPPPADKTARALYDHAIRSASEKAFRRERFRAWFHFAAVKDIYVDNVREWLVGALAGRHVGELEHDARLRRLIDDGVEMLKERLDWHHMTPGCNPSVRCVRLTLDPVRVMHRPLLLYAATNGVSYATIAWLKWRHSFQLQYSGKCAFLVKQSVAAATESSSMPILFCHGIGIGLGQYVVLLQRLARHRNGVVIALQPHISTDIFSPYFIDPPTNDEQVRATLDVLRRNRFTRCTTLSHSNGTMMLGWLLRAAPDMFVRNVLIDPVCFCLWEGSVCYAFVHRRWSSGAEVMMGFFAARELGIAYTIGRRFVWSDMALWVEELPTDDTHFVFAERDALVDVPASVQYLREAGVKDDRIRVMRDYRHGQALVDEGDGMRVALACAGVEEAA